MTEAWQRLSPRERLLVGAAAALLAVLLLSLLVVRPLLSARGQAAAEFERASDTYQLVDRAAATSSGTRTDAQGAPALRGVVSQTAREAGIEIDRYAIDADAVDVAIGGTDATRLFTWLGTLERQHGVVVREAQLSQVGGSRGTVSARLTLERAG